MAYNGSGTFNLASGNPVVTGTTISSTWANSTLSDIATGLSNVICKDGQSTPTANLPMGNYKFTGLAAGTTNGDSVRYEQATSAVAITGGTINGATIGATTASTGAFTTLSASSTVTLSGGTANGVVYLDGSKAVTSGSALTFDGTNLTVPAEVYRSSDTSYLRLAGGNPASNGASVLMFGGTHATNPGRLSLGSSGTSSTSYIDFSAGNSEQMRLTSTGLGIGTSSPSTKLHVVAAGAGALTLETTAASSDQTQITFKGTTGAKWAVGNNAATGGTGANFDFYDLAAGANRMRLDSAGNLGLGVTPSGWGSPYKAIQVGSSGYFAAPTSGIYTQIGNNAYFDGANWRYKNNGAALNLNFSTGGALYFETAPSGTAGNAISFTQAMTLDESGRLLVGVTSGSRKLSVYSSDDTPAYFGTAVANAYIQLSGSGDVYLGSVAGAYTVTTGGTEKFRIDTGGNVGIGTSSPSKKLEVYASANNLQIESIVRNDQPGTGIAAIGFNVSAASSGETSSTKAGIGLVRQAPYGVGALCFYNNSTASAGDFTTADERARIDSSGNFLIGTTSGSDKLTVNGNVKTAGQTYTQYATAAYGASQTCSITVAANGEPVVYMLVVNLELGGASCELITGYVQYSSNNTAYFRQTFSNSSLSVSVTGTTISVTNNATNRAMYMSILRLI